MNRLWIHLLRLGCYELRPLRLIGYVHAAAVRNVRLLRSHSRNVRLREAPRLQLDCVRDETGSRYLSRLRWKLHTYRCCLRHVKYTHLRLLEWLRWRRLLELRGADCSFHAGVLLRLPVAARHVFRRVWLLGNWWGHLHWWNLSWHGDKLTTDRKRNWHALWRFWWTVCFHF